MVWLTDQILLAHSVMPQPASYHCELQLKSAMKEEFFIGGKNIVACSRVWFTAYCYSSNRRLWKVKLSFI